MRREGRLGVDNRDCQALPAIDGLLPGLPVSSVMAAAVPGQLRS